MRFAHTLRLNPGSPVTGPATAGAAGLMCACNYSPQAPVDLIAKDLGYALISAQRGGVAMPVTGAVKTRFDAAHDAGLGGENLVAIAKLYR